MQRHLPLLLTITLLCHGTWSAGQQLALWEDSLVAHYQTLKNAQDDAGRTAASEAMRSVFLELLNDRNTFEYPFSRLTFSALKSSDSRVRIFNWNEPRKDGTFRYYAFVMMRNSPKEAHTWVELTSPVRETDRPETKFLTVDKWFGALYYEIIPVKSKRNKPADTYVLLGWAGKDFNTTRKVIDALTLQGNGKVRLGAPIFETPSGTRKRILFEFSSDVSMSVKYYPKKNCIVMDHLSPKNEMMEGIWSEYGPDGSYDLLQLENGKWKLYENIDVSRFSSSDDRPYTDPRLRR